MFKKLGSWMSNDVAIDLGTANTVVHVKGQGIVAHREDLVTLIVHSDHGGFVANDALSFDVDQGIGCSQVDREIVGEQTEEEVEDHRPPITVWPTIPAGRAVRTRIIRTGQGAPQRAYCPKSGRMATLGVGLSPSMHSQDGCATTKHESSRDVVREDLVAQASSLCRADAQLHDYFKLGQYRSARCF